jgi:hypothetical protein
MDRMLRVEYDFSTLLSLLGLKRSDSRIQRFIRHFGSSAIITVFRDEAEGMDDECVEFKELGFGLAFDEGTLRSIHVHSGEKGDDYGRYGYPLPMEIRFEHSKSDVLSLLGSPAAKGGGIRDEYFGNIPDWVRYHADGYTVHVEFSSDLRQIRTVTLEEV